MKHYFTEDLNGLASNPKNIKVNILNEVFTFTTDNGVFSKDYLDYASGLLLNNIVITDKTKTILDVGCGYGPIGIILKKKYAKEITMIDINQRALDLAMKNAQLNQIDAKIYKSNCLDEVEGNFDMIITNPPIRAGKDVVYKIFEQSYDKLNEGGELWLIIQKSHGAPSAFTKLESIYSMCEITYKKKGFFIIKCTK